MVEPVQSDQWVVLKLGPKADGEDPDIVRASIRHSIRDAEVFIPASVTKSGEEKVIQYLVEGYAFVRRKHPDATYMRLENTKYVEEVLREAVHVPGERRSMKRIGVVTNEHIEKFRKQIRVEVDQGIGVNDTVMITSGPYKRIEAIVKEEIPEQDAVMVHIKLRSKEAIITLPRGCLQLVHKAPRSPARNRVAAVREWLYAARKIAGWDRAGITHVLLPIETFMRLSGWITAGRDRIRFITSYDIPLAFEPIRARYEAFAMKERALRRGAQLVHSLNAAPLAIEAPLDIAPLNAYAQGWERLFRLSQAEGLYLNLASVYKDPPASLLDTKVLNYEYLNTVFARLDTLRSDLDGLESTLRQSGRNMMQPADNIIIDGTQLAIRCLMTPGLNVLTDAKGRPTGAILGFLNSLGSIKKKFSASATVTVTWDGSSQRRRKLFDGYKANRSARPPIGFEIEVLQAVLPQLGVTQVWNPEEEADDVIATLVRGPLKGKQNVIVSTDRDLLQLVTEKDHLFVPAVGVGKEKVYDPDAVLHEYGVPPDLIVTLRAISGDTSDNIPGAEGFGLKTAGKLVKLYESVDRLFASNLAGLTKTQYSSLRAAERQVKLNVGLMKLHEDLELTVIKSDPNQTGANGRLRDVDINPDPILANFREGVADGSTAHV